ncbi:MAG: hypothetical protein ACP5JG_12205 [Anaerolineae bacterium]
MNSQRRTSPERNPLRISLVAIALAVAALGFFLASCAPPPLLEDVTLEPSTITPNADGEADVAVLEFKLNQNANVSFKLTDNNGRDFYFRAPSRLSVNEERYRVLFGGVVEGYRREDEDLPDYTIIKRILPDGPYTWALEADNRQGQSTVVTGTLVIENADTLLPGIRGFSVSPKVFSPNQDGIADRVTINLALEKDVASLRVYLVGADGVEHHIAEDEKTTPPNERGWHTYDYDGGIDAGNRPPPDGVYTVYAEALDDVGQHLAVSDTVEIVDAGIPRGYILNGEVEWSDVTLVLSDTLCFTTTVENDSDTYLRTTGPWPGTLYQSDQNFNAFNRAEESGVFRIAMEYDTSLRSYPFRWGIGRPGVDLVEIDGYWYLPPRQRSLITGCVQIVDIPVRNPLYYWLGLIHEDVGIEQVNNRVAPNFVTIWEPGSSAP